MKETDKTVNEKCNGSDPLESLRNLRKSAPVGFTRRVVSSLPDEVPEPRAAVIARFWPEGGRWWLPALAGAAAALLAVLSLQLYPRRSGGERITVHFTLHAPSAQKVELLGDFTGWKGSAILLAGPDASGHWTADVKLPAGRHEYIFLVDGHQWQTDPRADIRRDDGFGRENAVVEL